MKKELIEETNKALEKMFMPYDVLAQVRPGTSDEPMVAIKPGKLAVCATAAQIDLSSGEDIYVGQSVVARLEKAQEILSVIWPGSRLEIVYGFRHPDVQKKAFEKVKADMGFAGKPETPEIRDAAHKFVASPDVAGHPTGGAVDLRILDRNGKVVDMGTAIHDLNEGSFTFSPFVSRAAWQNRQILRICMTSAGFAPFDGEWWHFSFGDREWAAYYSQPESLYSPAELPAQAKNAA